MMELSMAQPPDAVSNMKHENFVSLAHGYPLSQHAALTLASWGPGMDDGFHAMSMPMEWPATTLNMLDAAVSDEQQYATPSTDWLPPMGFGRGGIETDSFESSDLSQYPQSSLGVSTHHCMPNPSYSVIVPSLEADLTRTLPPTYWQQRPEYQLHMPTDYDAGYDRKRTVQQPPPAHPDAEEEGRWRGKRGRPPTQRRVTDIEYSSYTPPAPSLRRCSTSGTSYTTSPRDSMAAPSFDTTDVYVPSGSGSDSGSETATTPPSPEDDSNNNNFNVNSTRTATQKRTTTTSRNRRTSTSTSTTTTTTNTNTNTNTSSNSSNRNRAAASRYRAKTQAALAQLEAEEHDDSVRRQSLLACAGQLRDEVFQLKNELLRHAAECGCPLIRGYLSHAAEQACAGLRAASAGTGSSSSRSGRVVVVVVVGGEGDEEEEG
ncbi:hypothetical protein C8A00DRAFT_30996 [Chaetomidium leptoderma]|uniref:BZIP domain-containing protein n=1 Tax=Chaetomidium leptoderma TaxID=669021 RepID=A0AAN7A0X3_9PEZI|nr:hypothetical protein C8A00DRAFT_30996 [Chaetomidium leptoderma]